MTRIAFSHDIFLAQQMGGISRCMLELMRALAPLGADWGVWAGVSRNELLAAAAREAWSNGRIYGQAGTGGAAGFFGRMREERRFGLWIAEEASRIVHRTYYPLVDRLPRGVPQVQTLHDMWDERGAGRGDYRARARSIVKRRALRRADLIVCVSESSREQLLAHWPWASGKVCVIHHGVRRLAEHPLPATQSRPFFLFVGRRGHYKGFGLALRALARTRLADHHLVCFGGGAFADAERSLIAAEGLADRVQQVDGDDACLAGLYEAADALLYPSSYEGFGLPLLEAMIHGCPVLTTRATSLPEVGGDAAFYADADDLESWVAAMTLIAGAGTARSEAVRKGRIRAEQFSWTASARKHLQAYEMSA